MKSLEFVHNSMVQIGLPSYCLSDLQVLFWRGHSVCPSLVVVVCTVCVLCVRRDPLPSCGAACWLPLLASPPHQRSVVAPVQHLLHKNVLNIVFNWACQACNAHHMVFSSQTTCWPACMLPISTGHIFELRALCSSHYYDYINKQLYAMQA